MPKGQYPRPSLKDRFEKFIEMIPESGCWIWTGATRYGYGVIRINRINVPSHRASWLIYRNNIPFGNFVLHSCDTPLCVNPDHLFIGTQKENMIDMLNKNRANKARGERNGQCKLTPEQVVEIRNDNRIHKEIAHDYNISKANVSKIKTGRSWNYI